ncbi:MAG: hypothetical protein AAFW75_04560, partial [Cyanobacteria bacterium J06636_16]
MKLSRATVSLLSAAAILGAYPSASWAQVPLLAQEAEPAPEEDLPSPEEFYNRLVKFSDRLLIRFSVVSFDAEIV